MVRRRARNSSKPAAATPGTLAVVPNNLLEEQYFASPKRKDCKVDGGLVSKQDEQDPKSKGTSNSPRTKTERTIGVPLATRSQTRTIENFFKAKTAKENSENITQETIQTPSPCADLHIVSELCIDLVNQPQKCGEAEYIFEISDDDETINTEISEEATSMGMGPNCDEIDFIAHPTVSLDGSCSSRSSTNATDNIFLQEPVLTLNVDKTPNQASSIKINKSIEVEPVFSSPPAIATSALHGRFNQIVSMNGTNEYGSPSKLSTQRLNGCFMVLPENDNSSCDSGVGFAGSIDNNNSNKSNGSLNLTLSYVCNNDTSPAAAAALTPSQISTRRRKPATPHRILCPSPTKVAPRGHVDAHNGRVTSPNAARKKDSTILSPRKSPRHFPIVVAVASKTRRRLNPQQQPQPKDKAPYQNETRKTTVQNGYKQQNEISNVVESLQAHNYDNSQETTAQQTKVNTKQTAKTIIGANKLVANNINNTKKNQTLQPLATTTTNTGNRELTEFFPVRRSVRKTKTAVKEEMQRTLEQAVLEERAEGLKIAHFEGKGRGIVAERRFQRGEFVVEYIGDLISMNEAMEREKRYALDENAGCYMYYFKHKNQQYCIDATLDTGKLGRLVNHSRNGNLSTKVVVVKQRPHLVLLAKDDILPGEELTYDYGDRSKESLMHHPWLAF